MQVAVDDIHAEMVVVFGTVRRVAGHRRDELLAQLAAQLPAGQDILGVRPVYALGFLTSHIDRSFGNAPATVARVWCRARMHVVILCASRVESAEFNQLRVRSGVPRDRWQRLRVSVRASKSRSTSRCSIA
jgi:hypothetical protein